MAALSVVATGKMKIAAPPTNGIGLDGRTSTTGSDNGAEGKSESELQQRSTYAGWSNILWTFFSDDEYPKLAWEATMYTQKKTKIIRDILFKGRHNLCTAGIFTQSFY